MRVCRFQLAAVLFYMLTFAAFGYGQDYNAVQIKTYQATDNVYMLEGKGGNLGVCIGDNGVFLIDDQYAPLTEKIKLAISKLTDKDIRFVINTHWHSDHVGGNENLGTGGAVIVAHENVRNRMSSDQFLAVFNRTVPASPKAALPVITFTRDIKFHLNGEQLEIIHLKNAHTDGDAIVWFKNANVIHTGDIYFAGTYPFIDTASHGSITGIIAAVEYMLSIIDDNTRVIPGHGPMSNKAKLKAYLNMLKEVREKILGLIAAGKSLPEILKQNPTQAFDETWGKGFLTPEKFVRIVHTDLTRTQ